MRPKKSYIAAWNGAAGSATPGKCEVMCDHPMHNCIQMIPSASSEIEVLKAEISLLEVQVERLHLLVAELMTKNQHLRERLGSRELPGFLRLEDADSL
ncbi:hypothetical protein [Silvibacterium dinghuense]|uniref:Uncharacterized protein n=1 Tax=Silvibacterium dinghuense TaxID=1560006 RepID=A0A4Q1SJ81_9BACT|nr:hypothetical protein [Silvibacterium dinghuense]RXS97694.1 hypothetical protein ESZ00_07420 [Silvibacterium dinghuense]